MSLLLLVLYFKCVVLSLKKAAFFVNGTSGFSGEKFMARHADRFWEIDCLRGFAVLLMLLYHLLYDLDFFGIADIELRSGPLLYAGRGSAFVFILISGTALSISHSRALDNEINGNKTENFTRYLKRGIRLFFMGLLLTVITWSFCQGSILSSVFCIFLGFRQFLYIPS